MIYNNNASKNKGGVKMTKKYCVIIETKTVELEICSPILTYEAAYLEMRRYENERDVIRVAIVELTTVCGHAGLLSKVNNVDNNFKEVTF
jgi:hypothetical protein